MMNKKIIGFFICMLLIATVIPGANAVMYNDLNLSETFNDYNSLEQIISSLNKGNWSQLGKINASDGEYNDIFGLSVSLDGDYALIGARYNDNYKGSAYVFKHEGSNWIEEAKLQASDGEADDRFGFPVSLDGDYALIGAAYDDSQKGSAYVFKREGSNWIQEAKLQASDGEPNDYFGVYVSLDGNYALIGAYWDDNKTGSAYVFKREGSNWIEEAKLQASGGEPSDWFGAPVFLKNDYALIGAVYDDSQKGSAYVFKREGSNWIQEAKLQASDGEPGDKLCYSISLNGNYTMLGAAYDDSFKGSAYVFKREGSNWIEEAKLQASDGDPGDGFGYSASLDGDYAIIGAPGSEDSKGSAYVFKREGSNWIEEAKLQASDGNRYSSFGSSISLDGDIALIGAPGDDDTKGSAYFFKKEIENQPPTAPYIDGPQTGKPGTTYEYVFNSIDDDGDDVRYHIDWGDDTSDETDFNISGVDVTVSHTWSEKGEYTITAYAEDEVGATSRTSIFKVTIPRGKAINNPFLYWLQSHPNLFPLVQKLIKNLGL